MSSSNEEADRSRYGPGTVAGDRREMRTPTRLGGVVPGWRNAMVLRDPNGAAAQLRSEARKFRWSSVRRVCDTYVAEQLVGWAQHVAKLLRAMETGERETASVQRGLLANRMAFLRALELEYLWGTENGLWERVGERAGPEFRTAQRAALGIAGETWREACEAALRLYSLTAQANLALLQGERRRIVEEACRRAGYPIDGKGSRPALARPAILLYGPVVSRRPCVTHAQEATTAGFS